MKEILIDEKYEGIRLDKYLKKLLCNCSDSFIYRMLRKKNIFVNDRVNDVFYKLKNGDKIFIFFKDETYEKFTNKNIDKQKNILLNIDNSGSCDEKNSKLLYRFIDNIIYEDDNIIIIDKWDGIKSQKDNSTDITINDLLINYLRQDENDVLYNKSILNRLDTNTKGLMICAKNYQSSVYFSKLINDKNIKKYYLFVVNGLLTNYEYTDIVLYLKKQDNKAIISNIPKDGYKKIITKYKVLKTNNKYSYVEAELLTGRFHQIRASFSYINHPLVLDKKYIDKFLYEKNKKDFKQDTFLLLSYKIVFNSIIDERFSYLNNKTFYSKQSINF